MKLVACCCCWFVTSAEEGCYVFSSVCLSVCLSVCPSDNWKSCERILTKFLGGVGHGSWTDQFNFGDDPDHCPDLGVRSPKSAFTGLLEKLPMDFDDILWRAGVWPIDQLITFCWWCASLSGSEKNCHVVNTHRTDALQKSLSNSIMLAFGWTLSSLSTSSCCIWLTVCILWVCIHVRMYVLSV